MPRLMPLFDTRLFESVRPNEDDQMENRFSILMQILSNVIHFYFKHLNWFFFSLLCHLPHSTFAFSFISSFLFSFSCYFLMLLRCFWVLCLRLCFFGINAIYEKRHTITQTVYIIHTQRCLENFIAFPEQSFNLSIFPDFRSFSVACYP